MRLLLPWSLRLCCVGLLLFFVHNTVGQGTRELIDLTPQPAQPTPTPTPIPGSQSGRVLIPTMPSGTAGQPGGMPSGGTPPPNVPLGHFGGQLGSLLQGTPVSLPSSDPSASAQPPAATDVPRTPASRSPTDRISSVLEDETEDEREERELRAQRQRAELIADPERRQTEIERVQRNEANYRNRIMRRQADEAGADFFYFPQLKEQLLKDGWCQLFDGHTDFGWKIQTEGPYAGPWGGGNFSFGQGEIGSDPYKPGLIYTQIPFGDVNLRFDYWAEKDSRIFLLLKMPTDPEKLITEGLNHACYTFVLNSDQSNRPRGLLLGRHNHSLAELRNMRATWDAPADNEEGTWHSVLIRIEENTLHFIIDRRTPITYYVENPLRSGHIAFLVTKGKARFQNILWQPHQTISVFEPDSLTGGIPWRIFEKGDFVGNDDVGFHLFAGTVESKDVFADYTLQMQYYQGNNSGKSSLFVRSLPGMENTGYEISLQNFPRRKDRETIVGVDAGSFLGTKDARYVRALDQHWNHLTVVAMDRQVQTWVNGVPVCEIHDRRRVRENVPIDRLKDPFLNPGTIRFSVPQENKEFQFRRLTVSPI